MKAKSEADTWAVEQNDPDNWFRIAEFGVVPASVSFKGFAFPIVAPGRINYALHRLIREHVRIARGLVRLDISTLKDVNDRWFEVLELDAASSGPLNVTPAQRAGSLYTWVMADLKIAHNSSLKQGQADINRCLGSLTNAAEILREWILSRASGEHRAVDAAIANRNSRAAKERYRKDKDGKQQCKKFVKDCWQAWKLEPENYEFATDFARDMLDKHPETLQSQVTVTRWVAKWEKEGR